MEAVDQRHPGSRSIHEVCPELGGQHATTGRNADDAEVGCRIDRLKHGLHRCEDRDVAPPAVQQLSGILAGAGVVDDPDDTIPAGRPHETVGRLRKRGPKHPVGEDHGGFRHPRLLNDTDTTSLFAFSSSLYYDMRQHHDVGESTMM